MAGQVAVQSHSCAVSSLFKLVVLFGPTAQMQAVEKAVGGLAVVVAVEGQCYSAQARCRWSLAQRSPRVVGWLALLGRVLVPALSMRMEGKVAPAASNFCSLKVACKVQWCHFHW